MRVTICLIIITFTVACGAPVPHKEEMPPQKVLSKQELTDKILRDQYGKTQEEIDQVRANYAKVTRENYLRIKVGETTVPELNEILGPARENFRSAYMVNATWMGNNGLRINITIGSNNKVASKSIIGD